MSSVTSVHARRSSTYISETFADTVMTLLRSFPDEGDVDFVKAIKVYKEIGYPYMLMPDHVPAG